MSITSKLCVVVCLGASGSSVAEMEALRSALAEHDDLEVAVYESERPTRSDIPDLFAAMPMLVSYAPRSAGIAYLHHTAPSGNSSYAMRSVLKELSLTSPTGLMWPGHLYRRRMIVRLVSA